MSKVKNHDELSETLNLPVGLLIDGTRHKQVTIQPLTVGDSYKAVASADEGQLLQVVEQCQQINIDGLNRNPSYDELMSASAQDGRAINHAIVMLEKKEREQAAVTS